MLPHIYWINLERSVQRRSTMEHALAQRKLANTRVVAVDGKNAAQLATTIAAGDISPPVAATIASHLRALQVFSQSSHNEAIVMEDDTIFDPFDQWPAGWNRLRRTLPLNYGALQLCVFEEPHRLHRLYLQKPDVVRYAPPGFWSTGAYLITKNAAAHVVSACEGHGQTLFDIASHAPPLVADSLLFRLVATTPGIDGPWVARIPLFWSGADESEVHPDHAGHQRRALRFMQAVHPALRAGRYGRLSLLAHRVREAVTSPWKNV